MVIKKKRPNILMDIICPVCDGESINPNKPEEKCPECSGTGKVKGIINK